MKKTLALLICIFLVKSVFGQIIPDALEIKSPIFNGNRKVKVYLPSEYHNYPNRKYNVIFLFDAQSKPFLNYTKATLDYLSSSSNTFISPTILVGIETMRSRQFEFLPKNRTDQPLKDYFAKVELGGADSLALSLNEEIIPFINSRYRCTNYRIGIGHSLGASFVTYALTKYPNIFSAVIAVSPNYYYDHEQLLTSFDSLMTGQRLNNKFLFIAYGGGDKLEERFKPSTEKMAQILHKKNPEGLHWHVQSLQTNSHALTPIDGIYRGLIELNKLFTASDEQIDTFYKESPIAPIGRLKTYYQQQSNKLGASLPTIEDVTHIAYNLFYADKKKDALSTLEWALSLYPDDTNLYDSIGEMYQDEKNSKEAISYYSKGMEIIEKEKDLLSPKLYQNKVKWFTERMSKNKSQN